MEEHGVLKFESLSINHIFGEHLPLYKEMPVDKEPDTAGSFREQPTFYRLDRPLIE
ncbi:MAG: hypothetical protein OEW18_06390 [Candidatus Aminicenantes bacterium]|nr:hypothetical protein [Candidatus Aminicenantes bacterium]